MKKARSHSARDLIEEARAKTYSSTRKRAEPEPIEARLELARALGFELFHYY